MGRVREVTGRYLADTQVLLWTLHDDPRLPSHHAEVLRSSASVLASFASLWEVSIKVGLGKLRTVDDFPSAFETIGVELLPIAVAHIAAVRGLPRHHGDPFDRMLIAQAQIEGLTVLTTDRAFCAYGIEVV
jgi:PIN domain nuclease of toxin-antitoxin system